MAKDDVAEGVVALTLHDLDGHPLPRWEPGSHLDLILGSAATRQYSLYGDPDDPHVWRLGILRDPHGSGGSLYVHDRLQTPVLEGVPDHRDSVLDQEAREANDCMMICASRACTPRLVLDI